MDKSFEMPDVEIIKLELNAGPVSSKADIEPSGSEEGVIITPG